MNEKERIREQLSAYLDAELNEGDAKRVARAAEADPHVAAEIEQLSAVRRLVRSLPRERAPKGFVSDVLATVERVRLVETEAAEPSGGALRWVRYLATAAVLLVFVGIAAVVTAVLWKTSDYHFAPGSGRDPGVAIVDSGDRTGGAGPAKSGDPKKPHLAAENGTVPDAHGLKLGGSPWLAFALAEKEEIWTDDLNLTEQEVEFLFVSNGIVPAGPMPRGRFVEDGRAAKSGPAAGRRGGAPAANFFQVQRRNARQVQFVVVAPPDRARQVLAGVRAVRAGQRVPQRAPAAGESLDIDRGAAAEEMARNLQDLIANTIIEGLCGKNHIDSNLEQSQQEAAGLKRTSGLDENAREQGRAKTGPGGPDQVDKLIASKPAGTPCPSRPKGDRPKDEVAPAHRKAAQTGTGEPQSILIITLNDRAAVSARKPATQPCAEGNAATTQKSATPDKNDEEAK